MNQATAVCTPVAPTTAPVMNTKPDFNAIKQRQQATWASGDFAVVGTQKKEMK